MPSKHILVPTDFSESSSHALDYAITFARKLQAQLTVLHIVELSPLGSAEAMSIRRLTSRISR
jgi:nucleotide-binding universal stress UspA family protein